MITRYPGNPITPLADGVPFVPAFVPSVASRATSPAPIREGRFDLGEGWALVLEVSCDENTCLATLTNDAESVTELYGDGPGFPDAILALLLRAKRLKLRLPATPAGRFYLITDRASAEIFANLKGNPAR
jgi:hypothetical protein